MDETTTDSYEGWAYSPDPMSDHLVVMRGRYPVRMEKAVAVRMIHISAEPYIDWSTVWKRS